MSARLCAAPGCPRMAPGRFNDFCPDHFFMIPKRYTDMCRRYRIECTHTSDDDARQHLDEQLQSYIRLAVSKLPQQGVRP